MSITKCLIIIYLSVICLAGGILHMLGTLLVRLISHSLTKITFWHKYGIWEPAIRGWSLAIGNNWKGFFFWILNLDISKTHHAIVVKFSVEWSVDIYFWSIFFFKFFWKYFLWDFCLFCFLQDLEKQAKQLLGQRRTNWKSK